MPANNITATYDPTTNTLVLDPNSDIDVGHDLSLMITVALTTAPEAGGTALFAATPVTWGVNGPPPNVVVTGSLTSELTINVTNTNSGTGSQSFPFTVNVTYTANASADPTIINEGTGSVGAAASTKAA